MKTINVQETYQDGYQYYLEHLAGSHFHPDFKPELTPKEMLQAGIFGGSYFKSIPDEFPKEWFENVTLSKTEKPDAKLNFFQVNASQPLQVWQQKGWIYFEDPLGWFLWYCRYFQGRRIPLEDERQIKRWKAIRRHRSQIEKYCTPGDLSCRPRQRQALLHWAYDSRKY